MRQGKGHWCDEIITVMCSHTCNLFLMAMGTISVFVSLGAQDFCEKHQLSISLSY